MILRLWEIAWTLIAALNGIFVSLHPLSPRSSASACCLSYHRMKHRDCSFRARQQPPRGALHHRAAPPQRPGERRRDCDDTEVPRRLPVSECVHSGFLYFFTQDCAARVFHFFYSRHCRVMQSRPVTISSSP